MLIANTFFLTQDILNKKYDQIIAFLIGLVTIPLLYVCKIKYEKYLEASLFVYSVIWLGLGTYWTFHSLQKRLLNSSLFFAGCSLTLWQSLTLSIIDHITSIQSAVAIHIYVTVIRVSFLFFLRFDSLTIEILCLTVFIDSLSIYTKIRQERIDRKTFLRIEHPKDDFEHFKFFLAEHLPDSLIIINKHKIEKMFSNKAFQKSLDDHPHTFPTYKEYLRAIHIDGDLSTAKTVPETLASFTKGTRNVNLYNFLLEGSQIGFFEGICIVVQGFIEHNRIKKRFEIKVLTLSWDKEDAIAVLINDITQQETLISLKVANEHKDMVLATISHELKTPLNGILGIIHVIKKKTTDPWLIEMLDVCNNNGNLLLNIVNSMLDLHLIRKNKIKLYLEKISIRQIFEDIRILFDYLCKKKNITLDVRVADNVPRYIENDKVRLSEILINLTFNAVKFTYNGGIIVAACVDPDNSKNILFSVQDTGIGIHEEEKIRLSKMYGSLANISYDKTEGIGLGLAISHSLAKMLTKDEGIGLQFESEYQKGSRFYFSISQKLRDKSRNPADSLSLIGSSCNEEMLIDEKILPYSSIRNITIKSPVHTSSLIAPSIVHRRHSEGRVNFLRPLQTDIEGSSKSNVRP